MSKLTGGVADGWQQRPCGSRALQQLTTRMRAELRRARLQFKKGQLSAADYEKVINEYMQYAIREQERIGLDVLVHGEPERTDMCANLPAQRIRPPSSSVTACIHLFPLCLPGALC